ncbi:MAG: sugar phosphate isomerase/epimerase [Treponema sp.]|nr:sugar phosphate isomerase/epimerase [Treponema sp.]
MEYGICSWFGYKYPHEDRIKMIKNAGFQSVMTWWGEGSKEGNEVSETKPDIIRKHGLKIENAHFSFAGINSMWEDTLDGEEMLKRYFSYIDDCKKFEIPTAVMHLTSGEKTPPFGQTGLNRFKQLIDKAERNGITIAFENVRKFEYLEFLFANIDSDNLKFCYDCGHENCFTPGVDYLSKYGEKLAALHLHDNDGTGDQHMLPFSGTVNWEKVINKIKELNYKGALSLEVDAQYSNVLDKYSPECFLQEAKNRAYKLMNM